MQPKPSSAADSRDLTIGEIEEQEAWQEHGRERIEQMAAERSAASVRDEMVCDRCERRHGVVWFAPSDIWNAVMRGGDRGKPDEFSFCCPVCFMQLADERGVGNGMWEVRPEVFDGDV